MTTTTANASDGIDSNNKNNNSSNNAKNKLESLFPWNTNENKEKRIGFGTAGLRAKMKPGPMEMNDLVVIQTAQGLARYCQSLLPHVSSTTIDDNDSKKNPPL
eukprot:15360733-Ditylum_brightwellii.AAC.1